MKWSRTAEHLATPTTRVHGPGGPGHDSPCRWPWEGLRDTTLLPPGALRAQRRRRTLAAFTLLGVIVVLIVAGLAAWAT